MSTRTPPHNFEAEQALLGMIMLNNDAYRSVSSIVRPDHFADPLHGKLFGDFANIIDRGQVLTPLTYRSFADDDAELTAAGGTRYIARLLASSGPAEQAPSHAELIRDLWLRRQLIDIAQSAVDGAASPQTTGIGLIDILDRKLNDLAASGHVDDEEKSAAEYLVEALDQAEAAYSRVGGLAGVTTGLAGLDNLLGGLRRSDLIILAGRPSMGKTALATNIAFNAASAYREERGLSDERAEVVDGAAVGFFSLEMSGAQLMIRILGEVSSISSTRISQGHISSAEFDKLLSASAEVDPRVRINCTPALSIAGLRSRAHRMKRRHGLGLIVVDYLQLLEGSSKRDGRVQEISEITRGLKMLAKELDIPVVALSQLSRAVEQRDDKRPQLSDLRESGSIEQDADVVMFVYREEYYLQRTEPSRKPEESDEKFNARHEAWTAQVERARGKAEVIVAKHRHGATGTAHLAFDGVLTKFSDLADDGWQGVSI